MHRVAPILLFGGVFLFAIGAEAPASPDIATTPLADATEREQAGQVISTVAAEVAKLKARAAASPATPKIDRDPFRFGRGREPVTPAAPAPVVEAPAPEPVELPRLVALLETSSEAGVEWSASLSLGGDVRLAKVGATIGRFSIDAIDADVVVLRDASTSAIYRLTLR